MVVFMVIALIFSMLAYVVFGRFIESYNTFLKSISAMMHLLLGNYDYDQLQEKNTMYAGILFWCFFILAVFVVLNAIIAVIMEAYDSAKDKWSQGKEDREHSKEELLVKKEERKEVRAVKRALKDDVPVDGDAALPKNQV